MDLLEGQLIPGPGTLMRKSLWEKVGGYCEDHVLRLGNEDWDFYLSAAKNDFMAGHYSIPLYYYRLHPGSMTSNLHLYEYKTRNFMYRRHQNLFDRFNIGSYFRGEGYLRSFKGFWHIKK
jgi:hypothetical protein